MKVKMLLLFAVMLIVASPIFAADGTGTNNRDFFFSGRRHRNNLWPRSIICYKSLQKLDCQRLVEIAGLEVRIEADAVRMRKSEQRRMCGSAEKIAGTLGWRPRMDIDQSLRAVLQHHEAELTHA